jgi:hypothetical protein
MIVRALPALPVLPLRARRPPWGSLYTTLLKSGEIAALSQASQALTMAISGQEVERGGGHALVIVPPAGPARRARPGGSCPGERREPLANGQTLDTLLAARVLVQRRRSYDD